jgi:hypothetical protein
MFGSVNGQADTVIPSYADEYVHNDQTFEEKYWNDPVRFPSCWLCA